MVSKKSSRTSKSITKREKASQNSKFNQSNLLTEFEELANSLPEIIFETDLNGYLTFTNNIAFSQTGYSKSDFKKGINVLAMIADHDHARAKNNIQRVLKGENLGSVEYTMQKKNGSTFPVIINSARIVKDKKVVGLRGVISNISQRKKDELELKESNNLIESILRATPSGIGFIKNRKIQKVNDTFCKMTGYSKKDLIGKKIHMLHPDKKEMKAIINRSRNELKKHGKSSNETKLLCKNGKTLDVSLSLALIDKSDFDKGVCFTVLDITDRKAIEKDLRKSEERYRRYYENIIDVVFILDKDLKFTSVSPSIENIFGYKPKEWLGKTYPDLDIFAENNRDIVRTYLKKILRGETVSDTEHKIITKEGSSKHITINANPLKNGKKINGIIGIARDVTEKKRIEKMKHSLVHADRLMVIGQLAAGIAHEVNNPSAFVMANLSTLKENLHVLKENIIVLEKSFRSSTPTQISSHLESFFETTDLHKLVFESLEVLNESLEGMNRIKSIVNDLKVFSRMEKDKFERVQLNELVNVAANMTYNEIRHKARLEKDLGNMPMIMADRSKIVQVYINLLLNAAQAIPPGSIEKNKIRISTKVKNGWALFSVEDTGCGISPDVINRIYEPFFTTKMKDQGTGLGLALCADIIQKHDGKIKVRSNVGEGTRFEVLLPINTKVANHYKNVDKQSLVKKHKKGKVLIIDDEALLLKAYRRALESQHEITTAQNGKEAIPILESGKSFDVIICDIVMPEMDGTEFYNWLKDNKPELIDRLVFCSGSGFGTRHKEFSKRVNNIFIEKPLEMKTLKAIIDTILNKSAAK